MMRIALYVISDLHLGGAEASDESPGFQMCPPSTHSKLAAFIDKLPSSTPEITTHLVIAGDIVDFLAEVPFASFTVDQEQALLKLESIFRSTRVVWDSLSRFVSEARGPLTLLLGNHDIELSLPEIRRALIERLGPGDVRFIYDNEAFTLGPVLIEHGNRFDAWNAVPHSSLRRVRSQLSRRLPVTPAFNALPGSNLVVRVMNDLKKTYPFIDLLKPENAAALPLAMALGGLGLQQVWESVEPYRAQFKMEYEDSIREPKDPDWVNGTIMNTERRWWFDAQEIGQEQKRQKRQMQGTSASADAPEGGLLDLFHSARLDAVFWAFRKLGAEGPLQRSTFDVTQEAMEYLKPAQRSADAGFKVVIYGHTHLPKHVPLTSASGQQAVYLNTGTWADVMCIPSGIWDEDSSEGQRAFREFAGDLKRSSLGRWRRSMPVYAHVETDGNEIMSAALRFAEDHVEVTTDRVLERLAPGAGA